MTEQILTWVDEVQPTPEQYGDWSNPDERVNFYDTGLTVPAVARLVDLADARFDNGVCEILTCESPIGYRLSGEADEIMTWHWTTVVYVGRDILLVCETCSPSNVYEVVPVPSTDLVSVEG